MAEPTLVQVFGTGTTRLASGATTSTSGLFIPDSALTTGGATPSTATAEGVLVAITLNAKSYLTQANFDANIDQSLTVAKGFSSFTTRGADNIEYRQDQISLSLSKVDSGATIDPDDY
ncbi:MAG: hypothetical protein V7K27_00200 [Nostoc sp.]|uniref:hypothetical protein n=1 Tax=Nostoc sp. TaxID=1180 RepID=UPI002FF91512